MHTNFSGSTVLDHSLIVSRNMRLSAYMQASIIIRRFKPVDLVEVHQQIQGAVNSAPSHSSWPASILDRRGAGALWRAAPGEVII